MEKYTTVLKWFNNLQHRENLYIICFEVWEIYPSITKKLIIAKALNQ